MTTDVLSGSSTAFADDGRRGAHGGRRLLAGLLVATGRHDEAAFARFYQLTSPWIFGIFRRSGSVAFAETATRAVYVTLWQRAAGYSTRNGSALAWVTAIAVHVAYTYRVVGEAPAPTGSADRVQPADELSDLLTRCGHHDEAALAQFYLLTSPVLLALLVLRVSPEERVEPALAAIYVAVWRSAATFAMARESAWRWTLDVARRTVPDSGGLPLEAPRR